ncbi:ShlB/FhaC/HecB family hemolysin secretion/activation protein [Azotosporobacter soli]|uniref:ShlB/FhaC/HecB family hemolysin secretion/activation protein n=1 Tax=Azotosporobacter soli TaxID=3055040 RepID=UPI0031FEFFB5
MKENTILRKIAQALLLALLLPAYAFAAQPDSGGQTPAQADVEKAVQSIADKTLGKIVIQGNKLATEQGVLTTLPALRAGEKLDVNELANEILLANENGTRQITVDLHPTGETSLDAYVTVREGRADRFALDIDNTGNDSTGRWRTRLSYINGNIGGTGQIGVFSYATSPSNSSAIKQFGAYYNLPLPRAKDNLYITASYSDSNAGRILSGAGYSIDAAGQGSSFGVHYVHNLRRTATERRSLDFGIDARQYKNDINLNVFNTPLGIGTDVGTLPLSISYQAQNLRANTMTAYSLGYVRNIATGGQNSTEQYDQYRLGTSANYQIWRGAYQYQHRFANNWLANVAVTGQYTGERLVNPEQLGLGGARSLRGLDERELSGDRGVQGSFELYTPEIARGQRLLLFVDAGYLNNVSPQSGDLSSVTAASCGIGWRANWDNGYSAAFDYGYVVSSTVDKYKNNKKFHCLLSKTF